MRKLTPKHIIALKVLIHLVFLGFLGLLVIAINTDNLGGDPVQGIIHYTGISALNTLFITLLVSPLARWIKQGLLVRVRRLLGLYSFFWAVLHLVAFAVLDLGLDWSLLASEIVKRPYLTVGAAVWVILLLLAVTSTQSMQRKMGPKWKKLHNLVYLAVMLAPIHFYWSVKSELAEPTTYILIAFGLILTRWNTLKRRVFKK
ncbi:TPA: protein-methionine-sulfoxide reductase heme-binding subunit MsrQ [Vibrio vulnificus]|uniref:protein-methionine-sulfoxide reductase heme-binding subunit MsrQ n=1 Tax=Vibrio vulnificus TaxID=672 RepID=UPI001023B493|nr:protein-methionine-sulfoxide reductase heme-binding subunit MsrQ [Vibrio vulnificus]EHY1015754.1 protein-methionine-sulfoxide reductase heme-binding subunit MsrQ [Vibrio vulnificus]EHY1123031.1 protein-methionine-sulfoxide reductase heme-binding subunit MsrQ [Vibrio vulnificus]EKY4881876.1 protein-methionine-sulfoxide reductase heme-binding subunit MsrQ [Vibrio vulnificus]ELY1392740.1 protein-methionine-sulfoxide reductase heme-binding subunit MsrQ [Vibrio vulnificus]RZQ13867.1 protein-meth